MTNKHRWYDVIVTWANGEKIQHRDIGDVWQDYTFDNEATDLVSCFNSKEWRVKPKTITKKYRMALVNDEHLGKTIIALDLTLFSLDFPAERDVQGFIRWVSDMVEVEIESDC